MRSWMATTTSLGRRIRTTSAFVLTFLIGCTAALAQTGGESVGGEASLKLPDLSQVTFLGTIDGHKLLMIGLLFCALGLLFGLVIFTKLKNLPVHQIGIRTTSAFVLTFLIGCTAALAQTGGESVGGEASLKLPDLSQVTFLGTIDGHKLLMIGLLFCALGLLFGLVIFTKLKNLPVH